MDDCVGKVCPCLVDQDDDFIARRTHSRIIDRQLKEEQLRQRRTIKLLLLGSGDSGKTTFVKQMRIIHGKHFDDEELQRFKQTIYENIVKGVKTLIDAANKLNVPFGSPSSVERASFVFRFDTTIRLEEPVFVQYVPAMMALWKDSGIRRVFDRRREFHLNESVKYFLDNLDRIGQSNYTPTLQDILHTRKPSKGIAEHEVLVRGVPFVFVDIGGHRSQRQRWLQCFDNVRSILFLAASNDFDRYVSSYVSSDEPRLNRLVESADLFELIVNNRILVNVSVILFLNKTDLLREKIAETDIRDYLPAFSGNPRRLEDVQRFQVGLFDRKRIDRSQTLYHHFTTAIDTDNILMVFRDVRDTILQQNIRTIMPS